jgi:hypothetical protein
MMRFMSMAVLSAMALVVAAMPADAAPRKRTQSNDLPGVRSYRGEAGVTVRRTRTRITVTRRSYLDPGTEVRQGTKHYTDYVFPPSYRGPIEYYLGPNEVARSSLPEPFWLGSERAPNWGY